MKEKFDVIIIGGSYSGLAAAMALGRALRKVLVIDSGLPCNRQTPHSHNFLTHDGKAPGDIASLAKQQVTQYDTVSFVNGLAIKGIQTEAGFEVQTQSGESFHASKLIFATGIKDIMPAIEGFSACWGISVLHCPYCHGYEIRNEITGVLGNGEKGFEMVSLISNWTDTLTLYTDGLSKLTKEQTSKLFDHKIRMVEKEIERLEQVNGQLKRIIFKDGTMESVQVLYAPRPFEQHCMIPQTLGCELTEEGYIKTDVTQRTTIPGIYACGDNTTRMRTVANAVAIGTTAGMMLNKEIITEKF